MGKRGPKPTPTPVLKVRGSWRADTREGEPQPESGRAICPVWLNDEAKKVWKTIAPVLHPLGLLTKADIRAMGRYCTMTVRWLQAEQFLAKHGDTYPVRKMVDGKLELLGMKPFPQVKIAKELNDALLRIEDRFGMTASARASLRTPQPDTEAANPNERFFKLG